MNERAPAALWTAAQAAACDRHTIETLGVPSSLLMERAALCVSHEVMALRRSDEPVGVLVGPGNNGGDGLAVARQLHHWGVPVVAWMVADRHNATVAEQKELASAYGVHVHLGPPDKLAPHVLWVDALLGTGSRGPLRGPIAQIVAELAALARSGLRCIAIDVPTGVDADTGAVAGDAVTALCTVTMARSKPGLHITPGRGRAGRVVVADIGLVEPPTDAHDAANEVEAMVALLDPWAVAAGLRARPVATHKGVRGHVGVIGGSPGTIGAATLAAVAAMRSGAGLVTVASPSPGFGAAAMAMRPELMTAPWPDDLSQLLPRATTLVVGPGLTTGIDDAALAQLYRSDTRPALWDASALDRVPLDGAVPAGPRIITPHPGEAQRMLARAEPEAGWSTATVQSGRLAAVRRLARYSAAIVVLKGEGSLVAAPDGTALIGSSGGPALATAGSGDVLAGLGGAMLATGMGAAQAAMAAVHVHGVAGERLGADAGVLALEIAQALPDALRAVRDDPKHPRWPALRRG